MSLQYDLMRDMIADGVMLNEGLVLLLIDKAEKYDAERVACKNLAKQD